MTTWIGIDPGASGGIAMLYKDFAEVYPMPKTEADVRHLLFSIPPSTRAVIEAVHSFPGQGVASSFAFGRNYGLLRGILHGLGIPFDEVSPQRWQKALNIPPRDKKKNESKTEFKNRLKAKAQQLYPQTKVNLATADALLIARYAQLTGNGEGR